MSTVSPPNASLSVNNSTESTPSTSSAEIATAPTLAEKDARDGAAMSGLKRIVSRIKDYPHRYTDDFGAHFIRDYYDTSPERALNFFKRLEREGFRIKLTEEEEKFLENIRPKASPFALLPQARIVDGASQLLTRRNLLRKGAWVVGAIMLDRSKNVLSSSTKHVSDTTKDMTAVDKELEEDGLTHDRREELKAKKKELEEKLKDGPLGTIASLIKNNGAVFTSLLIIGYTSVNQGKDVVNHANQKADKTIDFLSGFIKYKLGYTIANPAAGAAVE